MTRLDLLFLGAAILRIEGRTKSCSRGWSNLRDEEGLGNSRMEEVIVDVIADAIYDQI